MLRSLVYLLALLQPLLAQRGPLPPTVTAPPERDLKLERVAPAPGHKLALVFGNNEYKHFRPLANAVHDAQNMASALTDVGFTVDLHTNANFRDMEIAINRFIDHLSANDTALLYYAGHGVQLENENYLIPVDLDAKQAADVRYGAYSASKLHDKVQETGAKLKIFIFDACRNNPFRAGTRSLGDGNGLAYMSSGRGSYIAFATAPNKVAYERKEDQNGLFTKHLLTNLRQPGLSLSEVFDRTRDAVDAESEGVQIPWSSTSVIGQFYFRAPLPVIPPPPVQPIIKEVIREVPKEVIREVPKEVIKEVIREVPKEVIKEVIREVPKEIIKEVRVPTPPEQVTVYIDKPRQAGFSAIHRKDRMEYVWIPAGQFQMGCVPSDTKCEPQESPRHQVKVTHGFWMGANEATVEAYKRYVAADAERRKLPHERPWWDRDKKWSDEMPMTMVTWQQAQDYCEWAGGRLPTEAEWEYAAREGKENQRLPLDDENSREKANFYGKQGNDRFEQAAPVRKFDRNQFGLFDMFGNVWEWCLDWYSPTYYRESPESDPQGPESGSKHVARGGSYDSDPRQHLRFSFRQAFAKSGDNAGFRCVLPDRPETNSALQLRD